MGSNEGAEDIFFFQILTSWVNRIRPGSLVLLMIITCVYKNTLTIKRFSGFVKYFLKFEIENYFVILYYLELYPKSTFSIWKI
jgi:hypothetical protein